jgi:hypothetical protein
MTEEATLERGVILPVAEFPAVVAADARRQELSIAHETAVRELARITIDHSDAQRKYRNLSAAVAGGGMTPDTHEWLDAKDQLRQLDERHGKVSLEVEQLRRTLDDALNAGRACRLEATRDREQQATQQTLQVAAEMVQLVGQLAALNVELTSYITIVGRPVTPVSGALDPQLLQAFINQLGGPKNSSRRAASAKAGNGSR